MHIILLIILILLLLYYLINNCKYKDIECFNDGSQISLCNDCEDCNNRGIANGIQPSCSCICKDGWSGTKCEKPPSIRPVFPDKIQRLPWNHAIKNEGYASIFLGKMNGKINGSDSYTSRLMFTLGPQKKCKVDLYPINDYKKNQFNIINYNPVIYNLAQFGFESISLYKRDYNPINFYKYRIELMMNLTKDNIPGGIHWYSNNIFEFKFYVRTFLSQKDFQNMNKLDKDKKPMKTACGDDIYSLRVTKTLNTDPIYFEGSVDFNITGNQKCPSLDHFKSTSDQLKDCHKKVFCKFDNGTIYNSCDNVCSNDSDTYKTVLYLELYRIDIKLI